MQRDTAYLSLLSPNTGKHLPEKTPYLDTFHAVAAHAVYLFFALNTYIILLTFIQFILIQFIIKQNSNKVIEVNVCLV